jgi:hypothetical protein
MHARKNALLWILLSTLAATAHAIDGRGVAVEPAAQYHDIDSSIKTELKRILRESLAGVFGRPNRRNDACR